MVIILKYDFAFTFVETNFSELLVGACENRKKNCEKMSINGVNESPPCEKFNEILVECKDLLIKKSNN